MFRGNLESRVIKTLLLVLLLVVVDVAVAAASIAVCLLSCWVVVVTMNAVIDVDNLKKRNGFQNCL